MNAYTNAFIIILFAIIYSYIKIHTLKQNIQHQYTHHCIHISIYIYSHIKQVRLHITSTVLAITYINIIFLPIEHHSSYKYNYSYNFTFSHIYTRHIITHTLHSSYSLSPDSVWRTSPLSTFHIFTVSSLDPDTTLVPSGEKATEQTASL